MFSYRVGKSKLKFQQEQTQTIYYDGIAVGKRRVDFVVDRKFIIEIKAVINLEDLHLAQAKNYVVIYDFPHGLLINFGSKRMQYKLMFNPKYEQNKRD